MFQTYNPFCIRCLSSPTHESLDSANSGSSCPSPHVIYSKAPKKKKGKHSRNLLLLLLCEQPTVLPRGRPPSSLHSNTGSCWFPLIASKSASMVYLTHLLPILGSSSLPQFISFTGLAMPFHHLPTVCFLDSTDVT